LKAYVILESFLPCWILERVEEEDYEGCEKREDSAFI